jgi:hypothetical protein
MDIAYMTQLTNLAIRGTPYLIPTNQMNRIKPVIWKRYGGAYKQSEKEENHEFNKNP